jgi:hypothetical protein
MPQILQVKKEKAAEAFCTAILTYQNYSDQK